MHGFAVEAVLPVARQKPAAHAVHTLAPVTLLNVPAGQGMAALTPAGQKDPMVHVAPIVTPADAQKVVAAQGFALIVELPTAVQKPAGHAVHAAIVVAEDPPVEKVPAGQGLMVPTVWLAPHQ